MSDEDARVAAAVRREARRIARAIAVVARVLREGGVLAFVGAGTSGRLGVIEAAECPPTFHTDPRKIRASMAGGRGAVFRSKEGAEDRPGDGKRAVAWIPRSRGAVAAIAASGVTPYVLGALEAARARGLATILITSNSAPAGGLADIVIAPRVGPEAIAGSTRLKAGTAAKMVLNMITTGAMIRLGKVFGNLMVDLKPTSRKLHLRAERLVRLLGRVGFDRARALLRRAGSPKLAIVMARTRLSPLEARRRLERAGGFLREALRTEVKSKK